MKILHVFWFFLFLKPWWSPPLPPPPPPITPLLHAGVNGLICKYFKKTDVRILKKNCKYFLALVCPQIITNVLTLDQIWRFQHKNGKNNKFLCSLHAFFHSPQKKFLLPSPSKFWCWCCHWKLDIENYSTVKLKSTLL